MKRPPLSARFEITQMRRVDFLSGALQRLQDDVGTILQLVDSHNHQTFSNHGRTIGYWASLRLILPIIEAISHAMGIRPQQLLGNYLNISTPNLMWDLFRHSLTHGDTLQEGIYRGKRVSWGVTFGLGGHVISAGNINIDVPTLYLSLVHYLQQEIAKNDQTLVDIETGVEYGVSGKPNQDIVSDFSKL